MDVQGTLIGTRKDEETQSQSSGNLQPMGTIKQMIAVEYDQQKGSRIRQCAETHIRGSCKQQQIHKSIEVHPAIPAFDTRETCLDPTQHMSDLGLPFFSAP